MTRASAGWIGDLAEKRTAPVASSQITKMTGRSCPSSLRNRRRPEGQPEPEALQRFDQAGAVAQLELAG